VVAATSVGFGLLFLVGALSGGAVAVLAAAAYGLVVGTLRLRAASRLARRGSE